jgi:uncharacterized pyridoxamine 5'-phosphate oxidase family protein
MSAASDFLKASQVQYFSTLGLDGKPKVRPFQFQFEEGGKHWFCTSNKKEVYRELRAHPEVEVCAMGEGSAWIRLAGRAVFVDDLAVKARIQDGSPLVKSIYKTPGNPDFEAFYLEGAVATIADFSGNPPRTFKL